jgi:hypothetical protein
MTGRKKNYLLKLDQDIWQEIEENRLAMNRLFPEGISKRQYIQNALISYGKSFQKQVRPKLDCLEEIIVEEPLNVFYSNGLEEYGYERF